MNKTPRHPKSTQTKSKTLTHRRFNAKLKKSSPVIGPQEATQGRKSPTKSFRKHKGGFSHQKTKKILTKKTKKAKMNSQPPVLSSKVPSRGIFGPPKPYLLIDGENFVHRIEEILKNSNLIKTRKDLKRLNFERIFSFCPTANKKYYSTTIRTPEKTHPLFKDAENIKKWLSTWVPLMQHYGIKNVKAGYLRVRDGKPCKKCGTITDYYIEKGVDVRIAVDLIENAEKGTTLYLVSSDTDLLPAILAAKRRGAKIIYVAFEDKVIGAISSFASSTRIVTNSQVKKAYKEVNKK